MSSASRFIRLVLGEYGLPVELTEEQPWEMRKDFIKLNPAGTLPVMVDDNMRVLCGPTVIAEFLDETSGILKRTSGCWPRIRSSVRKSAGLSNGSSSRWKPM